MKDDVGPCLPHSKQGERRLQTRVFPAVLPQPGPPETMFSIVPGDGPFPGSPFAVAESSGAHFRT